MLWAALRFPDLSLQLHLRGAACCGPTIVQEAGHRPRVLSCNEVAAKAGIEPGMPASAAHALVAKLHVRIRDSAKEEKALASIAAWTTQFTPTVSLASSNEVLVEISGCLRLFGGLRPLSRRIRAGLVELGYRAIVCRSSHAWCRIAVCTRRHCHLDRRSPRTATGIGAIAAGTARSTCTDHHRTCGTRCAHHKRLAVAAARWARAPLWPGLPRRDRSRIRHLPDPRPPFTVPSRYSASLELPAPVQETEPLLFAAKRLILELAGHLAMRQTGVTRLKLDLDHAHHAATPVLLGLSAPSRDAGHLVALLREKLATVELPDAVETLCLVAEETRPLGSQNQALFADGRPSREERWRIIEHLRARLGTEAVHGLEMFPDHRPELAFRKSLPGQAGDGLCDLYRPLWLLPRPLQMRTDGLLPQTERRSRCWTDRSASKPVGGTISTCSAITSSRATDRARSSGSSGRGQAARDWFLHGIFA